MEPFPPSSCAHTCAHVGVQPPLQEGSSHPPMGEHRAHARAVRAPGQRHGGSCRLREVAGLLLFSEPRITKNPHQKWQPCIPPCSLPQSPGPGPPAAGPRHCPQEVGGSAAPTRACSWKPFHRRQHVFQWEKQRFMSLRTHQLPPNYSGCTRQPSIPPHPHKGARTGCSAQDVMGVVGPMWGLSPDNQPQSQF